MQSILTVALAILLSSSCLAKTFVVDQAENGDFTDIQTAIDTTEQDDTIIVKEGLYAIDRPINFNGKLLRLISQSGADKTIIQMANPPANSDRASVVIFESGETEQAILEGFTLSGGRGTTWRNVHCGGAIFCLNSSPTISDCKIFRNGSQGESIGMKTAGGGLCIVDGSFPKFTSCEISGNDADFGGGLMLDTSGPVFQSCKFFGNIGRISGGGMYCYNQSSPIFLGCKIISNLAISWGGGAFCYKGGNPNFTNCIFYGNLAEREGGAILCSQAQIVVINCTIAKNQADSKSGIDCDAGCDSSIINSVITDNFQPQGILCNTVNSIIDQDAQFVNPGHIDFNRYFWPSETGPISALPDYIVTDPDLHLKNTSPCINAGTSGQAPITDYDGTLRPQGSVIDIGAYEFIAPTDIKFVRSDANSDGKSNLSDAIVALIFLFLESTPPSCIKTLDSNDDSALTVNDPIHLLRYLFLNDIIPPIPYPLCGIDGTSDQLSCDTYSPCL